MAKKISELVEATSIGVNDVLPVVNVNGTEKIKYSTLKTAIKDGGSLVVLSKNPLPTNLLVVIRNTIHDGSPEEYSADEIIQFENTTTSTLTYEFEKNLRVKLYIPASIFSELNAFPEKIRIKFRIITLLESDILKEDIFDEVLSRESFFNGVDGTMLNNEKIFSFNQIVNFRLSATEAKTLYTVCAVDSLEFLSNPNADVTISSGSLLEILIEDIHNNGYLNTKIYS